MKFTKTDSNTSEDIEPIEWTFPSATTLICALPQDNHCLLDLSGSVLSDLYVKTVINTKKTPVYISPILKTLNSSLKNILKTAKREEYERKKIILEKEG